MKHLLYTTAIALFAAGPAFSGSIIIPEVEAPPAQPASIAHDWGGFYTGVYYGVFNETTRYEMAGLQLGYNVDTGSMVYGGELDYAQVPAASGSLTTLKGRVGVKAGDNLLLFGTLGVGTTNTASQYWLAGLGAQYAFSDSFSLRVDASQLTLVGSSATATVITFGAVLQF